MAYNRGLVYISIIFVFDARPSFHHQHWKTSMSILTKFSSLAVTAFRFQWGEILMCRNIIQNIFFRVWWERTDSIRFPNFLLGCNFVVTLQWRHNGRDSVSNHQPHDCLHNRLFRRRSKKTSKVRVTGLCEGTSPVTGKFPAQMASNAENVSIWWRHHDQKLKLSK